jgi:hypoxanthine phosphoribosyltransferase
MISAKSIAARIEELAREIEAAFAGTEKLVLVGLLRGSFVFIADLVRELDLPVEVDFLEASSYGDAMQSSREVRILKDLRGEIARARRAGGGGYRRHRPHAHACLQPAALARTARLKTIALLDKPSRREVDVRPIGRLRDPGRVRRGLRHRLRAAQPQPALYRQGADEGCMKHRPTAKETSARLTHGEGPVAWRTGLRD